MQKTFDCSKLLIDFTKVPKGKKIVEFFPELKVYAAFGQQQDENVIKLAILTADKDSPAWKLRNDRELMIKAIFDFLEIGTQNKIGKDFLQSVLTYKHEGLISCWIAYLQMQYAIDFNEWIIGKETYDMLLEESKREKGKDEDAMQYATWRIKIRDHLRKIGGDLKEIEPKIFQDSKMVQPVAVEITKQKLKTYPEKYAVLDSLM